MIITDDRPLTVWLDSTLEDLSARIRDFNTTCGHCGYFVRTPIIIRKHDVDMFNTVMDSAFAVMKRHGITAALCREIMAEAHMTIAIRNAQKNAHEADDT